MRGAALISTAFVALAASACSETKTGLRVSVDPGDFKDAASLKIAVSALPDGFAAHEPQNAAGAYVTIEDFDGDGALDLLAVFNGPFPNTLSFRIATGNQAMLNVHAYALAYSPLAQVAAAEDEGLLPAGSEGVVSMRLEGKTGPVGPDTRTTDFRTAPASLTVKGPRANARLGPIAVCDVNGDGAQDLVMGAPDDDGTQTLGGVGGVYVLFGGTAGNVVDLMNAPIGQVIQFYGLESADHLGASVACAELNGDTFDDIVVGAPGAGNGAGRVYVVYGRTGLSTKTIDLRATSPQDGASVKFATAVAGARLGSVVQVADLDGTGPSEVLLAAPGTTAKRVHLYANLPSTGSMTAIDTDAADHVTFSGVSATAITAGDLDGMAPADIVLADRNFIPSGTINARGVVYVLPGFNPTLPRAIDIATTTPLLTLSGAEDGSLLGSSVLVADTSGRGADLIVGAPGDSAKAGVLYIYQHETNFFLSPTRAAPDGGMLTGPASGGRFGESLAASGPASGARLLVGAPATTRADRGQAGAAYVYVGNSARQFRLVDQVFGAAAQDHLGTFVAGGLVNGDQIGDLVTTAPDANGSDSGSGAAYVLVGR